MIEGRKVLAVIPARGGSKGLPGKNLRPLGGRPMLAWSVAAARASRYLDRVVLSSEDNAIIEAARAAGCDVPFRRPEALATDEASIYAVLRHAVEAVGGGFDVLVLLQPTSPLRRAEDIDGCLELMIRAGAPAAVSVAPAPKPPHWLLSRSETGRLTPFLAGGLERRRQDMPAAYVPNGAVYAGLPEDLFARMSFFGPETVGYVMPPERSVDVDSLADFLMAEALLGAARL